MMVSPLNQDRLNRLRRNRKGWWSLWLFIIITTVTTLANFIANDKPLVIHYDQQYYFPVMNFYSDQQLGGDYETEVGYRDPDVQARIASKGWMAWPLIRYSYDTVSENLNKPVPSRPDSENWLGTDDQGRDVSARLIYGLRTSILFGLCVTGLSAIISILIGATQGYFAGRYDLFFQRFIEIWSGLPILFLLIILGSFVQPNFGWLLLILLLFSWMGLSNIVRAEFLRARNFDYVRAAQVLGIGYARIIASHILPNAMVATLTHLPFILCGAISTLTSLDFLGFGLPPGSASLGELVAQGKNNLHAPWLGMTAFFTLSILLSLLIFIGEAMRDAFDVKSNLGQTKSVRS